MLDDIEDMIKQKLLEDLIDQMGDQSGSRLHPKGLAVEVQAPGKDLLSAGPESDGGDDEDLSRLMEMAGKDDDDNEDDDEESLKRGR